MNLTKLFEIQKALDERIIKEHGLQAHDLLDKKILALQVELGECANEWRGFKFWSKDQEPRVKSGNLFIRSHGEGVYEQSPLLEEYVDCLHFILSIGIDLENDNWKAIYYEPTFIGDEVTDYFLELYARISSDGFRNKEFHPGYMDTLKIFLGLGTQLGFTWEQIEQAYLDKNKINHERQANNY